MPQTISTFTSKNGKKFRIQKAPDEKIEEVMELFDKYFSTEETMHKAGGVYKNKEALAECKEFLKGSLLHEQCSIMICCLDDDPSRRVIAASIAVFMTNDDDKFDSKDSFDFKPKTEELKKAFEIIDYTISEFDATEKYNLDKFYEDRGLVVHPDFRGHGIAQEFFKARRKICAEENIPMTGAWVTSYGSQKAAERDGWETAHEISYDIMAQKFGVTFQNVPPTCKYVIARI